MMRNLLIIISLTCLMQSCSNKITGLYYNKDFNKNTPDYCFISIGLDSVYYQAHNDILGQANYKGTWTQSGDTLILDIPKPCTTKTSRLIEKCNLESEITKFNCKMLRSCGDTMELFYDTLVINDISLIPLDSIGTATAILEDIHKIELTGMFAELSTQRVFFPENPKSNDFQILLGETDDVQAADYALVNKRYLIDNNVLRRIYLENDTTKISNVELKRHRRCRR